MKKTYANRKDRIIIVPSESVLYFQPERTAQRYYLCDANRNVSALFRDKGRWDGKDACSMSVGQLYQLDRKQVYARATGSRRTGRRDRENGLLEYLASQINYVVRYIINESVSPCTVRCLLDDMLPDIA